MEGGVVYHLTQMIYFKKRVRDQAVEIGYKEAELRVGGQMKGTKSVRNPLNAGREAGQEGPGPSELPGRFTTLLER